ncbi:hypothetical protein ABTX82_01535 [Streptomyces lavendulae]|uniref:hypothetical protein n=1 Tax=Streptomyces lavendulae TaxID=1914 RepID=UPI003316AA61
MTAANTVWACIAVALGILVAATTGFDRWHKPRTTRRFQATARQAARTEADVAEDAADRRKQREVALLEAWLQIPCHPRNTIPHQTRRTEEDQ